MSCGQPKVATGITAASSPLRAASRAIAGVSSQECASTSAITGRWPARTIAVALATKVSAGTSTRAPGGRSSAISVSSSPAVAVLTVVRVTGLALCFVNIEPSADSSSRVSGPKFEYQRVPSMRRK